MSTYGGVGENKISDDKKGRSALLAGLGAVSALLVIIAFAASHLTTSQSNTPVSDYASNLLQVRALAGAVQRTQGLMETSLVHDGMADVMPLNYLIERETVDHGLHTGSISDTELALADEAKKKKEKESWRANDGGDAHRDVARRTPAAPPSARPLFRSSIRPPLLRIPPLLEPPCCTPFTTSSHQSSHIPPHPSHPDPSPP
eukprot:CAMPEP_0172182214 /NCGR_PEP_ID=MMETSP1050-20130122/18269_1 /TAXON_ID=233186 /ORGANISM="Cryptomonas curvata, Strain CCAP979/52" /LENGTH=201 /DNA_ID=CAMNT_0012855623 /DNA_START=12 /DNA_END=615 /DNA_ORIENTATION=-